MEETRENRVDGERGWEQEVEGGGWEKELGTKVGRKRAGRGKEWRKRVLLDGSYAANAGHTSGAGLPGELENAL